MTSRSREELMRIQQRLAHKGFDPGLVDGVWGRRTEAAVRAFQAANGLLADGIVGPKTFQALFGEASSAAPVDNTALVWFQEARRLMGTQEDTSSSSNRVILDWASDRGIPYNNDDIPWCGLFVAHCIGSTLPREPLPNNPLGARSWLKFGAPCSPTLGSVLVFWRGSRDGWKGHVGLYAGEEAGGTLHVLGGNQSNKVSITRIGRDRLLEARWPTTVPASNAGPLIVAAGTGILSHDEH
jgi:uncharacterized protein (TIGR02594 family)